MLAALYREMAEATAVPGLAAVLRERAERLERQKDVQSAATDPELSRQSAGGPTR